MPLVVNNYVYELFLLRNNEVVPEINSLSSEMYDYSVQMIYTIWCSKCEFKGVIR